MKNFWIFKNNSSKLIIFFNGWGMDQNPFLRLKSMDYDVITYYDYRELDNIDLGYLSKYKEIILIAWSFGVWVANYLLKYKEEVRGKKSLINKKTAINGTLNPVDNKYGIREKIFDLTLDNMDERGIVSFYKRMCCGESVYDSFIKRRPKREVAELKDELAKLKLHFNKEVGHNIFNNVIIADDDKIISTENQKRFWSENYVDKKEDIIIDNEIFDKNIDVTGKVVRIKDIISGHYLFNLFGSWDELAEL